LVDRDLLLTKVGAVRKHLDRAQRKCDTDLPSFLNDLDRQESVLFNIQLAIQSCIDIAAHIVSEEGLGVPGSTSEMFYLLQDNNYLGPQLTEKMVKAVGFRNLIVHAYTKLDLVQAYEIARKDIMDLNEFLKTIVQKCQVVPRSPSSDTNIRE
jgi:uncharacterized protein YutE (UPF0331/DUF86 family)